MGWGGQIHLGYAAVMAIGAYGAIHMVRAGVPFELALVGAGLLTVPVGALVAIPAIRLSGLYLALATFGFGLLLERVVFSTALMFGGTGARVAPRPDFVGPGGDRAFYFVCLAIVVVVAMLLSRVEATRLGLLLRAMADSPTALAVHGASVTVMRVLVFSIAAFVAGIGGALLAALPGTISGVGFGSLQSLMWLTAVVIGGRTLIASPVLATVLFAILPSYAGGSYGDIEPILFGVAVVVIAVVQTNGLHVTMPARWHDRARRSPVAERWALAR
jgi:ABC-type branched-subunit amino acid transport system permease subunit